MNLRIFRHRGFSVGVTTLSLTFGAFFASVVLLPLWLQQYMNYTATWAGFVMAPVGLLAILLSPLVGKTTQKVDPRLYATIAFLSFAVVLWLRSRFTTGADLGTLMLPTLVQGISMAFFFIPLVTLTLSGLPPERIPAASGLSNFARITAGAFGTSITTTLWDSRAAQHHAELVEAVSPSNPATQQALAGLRGAGLGPEQGAAYLNRLVDQQAFMLSANDIFLASAALFVALVGIVWLARPIHGAAADAGGAH